MTKTFFLTGTLIAALLVGSAAAYAAGGPGHGRGDGPRGGAMNFEQLDLDGDGSVTRAELERLPEARFAEADANGDGVLSAEEMLAQAETQAEARRARMVERMIERADTDGDGAVSLAEMQAMAEERDRRGDPGARFFRLFDDNNDGVVTAEEFETARAEMGGMRRGPQGGPRSE